MRYSLGCSQSRRFLFANMRADLTCNNWTQLRQYSPSFFKSIGLSFLDSSRRTNLVEHSIEKIDLSPRNHLFCLVKKKSSIRHCQWVVEAKLRINNWMRVSCFICHQWGYWIRRDPHCALNQWKLVVWLCFLWKC